jgi:hypothetical protein
MDLRLYAAEAAEFSFSNEPASSLLRGRKHSLVVLFDCLAVKTTLHGVAGPHLDILLSDA